MRTDFYVERFLPQHILVTAEARRSHVTRLENARQQEILELSVEMAIGASVPAKAVIAKCMRRHSTPHGIGALAIHRLIVDLDGAVLANSADDCPENGWIDRSPRS